MGKITHKCHAPPPLHKDHYYKKEGVLVGNFEKIPLDLPNSSFVGMA